MPKPPNPDPSELLMNPVSSFYVGEPLGANVSSTGSWVSVLAQPVALPDDLADGDFIYGDFILVPLNTSGSPKSFLPSIHFNGQLVMSWHMPVANNLAPTMHGRFGFKVGGYGGGSIVSNGSSQSALTRTTNGVSLSAGTPNTLDLMVYLNNPAHANWYIDASGTAFWFEAVTPTS